MSAATFVTRTYTPLAFRESTERWLVASSRRSSPSLWCVVIPLEIVLHESGRGAAATQIAKARRSAARLRRGGGRRAKRRPP